MLERIREIWDGEEIGPVVEGPPRLVVGGHADASFRRAARFADGWIASGGPLEQFVEALPRMRDAWASAGREGGPRTMALAYFSLGDHAAEEASVYLTDYYSWLREEVAGQIAASAAQDEETVRGYVAAFEGAGCDELILFPSSGDPDQVDLLAGAVGL